MKSYLLQLTGIPDGDESPPLEDKSREDLIELVKGLTEMTAQQARIIESLRQQLSNAPSPTSPTDATPRLAPPDHRA
jgi:hypothetical protein